MGEDPCQLIFTSTSPGPGVGTSTCCTGAFASSPLPTLTAAFCCLGMSTAAILGAGFQVGQLACSRIMKSGQGTSTEGNKT